MQMFSKLRNSVRAKFTIAIVALPIVAAMVGTPTASAGTYCNNQLVSGCHGGYHSTLTGNQGYDNFFGQETCINEYRTNGSVIAHQCGPSETNGYHNVYTDHDGGAAGTPQIWENGGSFGELWAYWW
jgi:hypothetical protein